MRSGRLAVLWVTLAGLAGGPAHGQETGLEAFFRPPADVADRPADELYPAGRKLLFSLYSVRSVKGDWAQPGFTAIGPYYGAQTGPQFAPHANVVDAAKALGVKCFYRVGMDIPFLKEHTLPSDEAITTAITDQVKAVVDRPEIAIWYVTPEELRYWRADEMRYLKVACAAIRAADPQGRPIMLYEPNHRDAGALERTLPDLDFSSKGLYANAGGFQDLRTWIRWGVEQELAAIAKVKPTATPLAVLWMAGDPALEEVPLIQQWTRHDVYLSLVCGAKGVVIWSGFRRGGFTTFDEYLAGYAAAAEELNGPRQLGQVFLFGERRDDLAVVVQAGPARQELTVNKAPVSLPTVACLDAAYGPHRYLFLVNSATEAVTVRVTGLPAGLTVTDLFGADPAGGPTVDWTALSLAPYEVRAFRFGRR